MTFDLPNEFSVIHETEGHQLDLSRQIELAEEQKDKSETSTDNMASALQKELDQMFKSLNSGPQGQHNQFMLEGPETKFMIEADSGSN